MVVVVVVELCLLIDRRGESCWWEGERGRLVSYRTK